MADPLSIAVGVVSLLNVTGNVAFELHKFHRATEAVEKTIQDLQYDVESLRRVLETMRSTFESMTASSSQNTGHIGALWDTVARSVADAREILSQLQSLLADVNKDVSLLNDHRKQARLNRAQPEIANYRTHIQSFKDGLGLSLQAIILWNQERHQRSTDEILPNLNAIQQDIRRIGSDLNKRVDGLESKLPPQSADALDKEIGAIQNLQKGVRAAAATISSASTVRRRSNRNSTIIDGSIYDTGSEDGRTRQRKVHQWMESHSVDDYEDDPSTFRPTSIVDILPLEGTEGNVHTQARLDLRMVQALLKSGNQKMATGDYAGALSLFQRCIETLPLDGIGQDQERMAMRLLVMDALYLVYEGTGEWILAQKTCNQRLQFKDRNGLETDSGFITDILRLAKVTMHKGDHIEAELQARRAWNSIDETQNRDSHHHMRIVLPLLIELSKLRGDRFDEEGYSIMLAEISEEQVTDLFEPSNENSSTADHGSTSTISQQLASEHPNAASERDSAGSISPIAPNSADSSSSAEGPKRDFPASEFQTSENLEPSTSNDNSEEWYGAPESTISPWPFQDSVPEDSSLPSIDIDGGFLGSIPMHKQKPGVGDAGQDTAASEPGSNSAMSPSLTSTSTESPIGRPTSFDTHSDANAEEGQESFAHGPLSKSAYLHGTTPMLVDLDNSKDVIVRKDVPRNKFRYEPKHADGTAVLGTYTEAFKRSLFHHEPKRDGPQSIQGADSKAVKLISDKSKDAVISRDGIRKETRYVVDYGDQTETSLRRPSHNAPEMKLANHMSPSARFSDIDHGNAATSKTARVTTHEKPEDLETKAKHATPDKKQSPDSTVRSTADTTLPQGKGWLDKANNFKNSRSPSSVALKVVVTGDHCAEKTKLCLAMTLGKCENDHYIPTVFDNYSTTRQFDGRTVNIELWDTQGQEDYDRLRPLTYPQTDVFLVCFSIVSPSSFDNVVSKWHPEIRSNLADVPLVLVGTQLDLRDDAKVREELLERKTTPVTSEQAECLRKEMKAEVYMECSAITGQGIPELVDAAMRVVLRPGSMQRSPGVWSAQSEGKARNTANLNKRSIIPWWSRRAKKSTGQLYSFQE